VNGADGLVDRVIDDRLAPAERLALAAHLAADARARREVAAELRLGVAVGEALRHDDDGARQRRADLVMAILSDSRRLSVQRAVEAAIGLEPIPAAGRAAAWRIPAPRLVASACAAGLLLACAWWLRPHRDGFPDHASAPLASVPARAPEPSRPAPMAPTPAPRSPAEQPPVPVPVRQPAPVAPVVTRPSPQPAPVATVAGGTAAPIASRPTAIADGVGSPVPPDDPTHARTARTTPAASSPGIIATATAPVVEPEPDVETPPPTTPWVRGAGSLHRHGAATAIAVRGAGAALGGEDVLVVPPLAAAEVFLGADIRLACAPATRIALLPPRPGVPGRRTALAWGEVTATSGDGVPAIIVTAHGEVRCDEGEAVVAAYPGWTRVAVHSGRARVGTGSGTAAVAAGEYAIAVRGKPVGIGTAGGAPAVAAGQLISRGTPLLPCVLRLDPAACAAGHRRERFQALADAGFAAVAVPAGSAASAVLADAADAGLGAIVELPADTATITAAVTAHRGDAALWGWSLGALADVPRGSDPGHEAALVRRLDPLHALAATQSAGARAPVQQVGMIVVPAGADAETVARWSAMMLPPSRMALALVPFGASGPAADAEAVQSMRCAAWAAVAAGARGLVWSSAGGDPAEVPGDGGRLDAAAAIAAELAPLAPLLLGPRHPLGPAATGVAGACWEADERCLVVVANAADRPVAIDLAVPVAAAFAGRAEGGLRVAAGRVTGILAGHDVAVLVGRTPFKP
jgi:hypothetical protein